METPISNLSAQSGQAAGPRPKTAQETRFAERILKLYKQIRKECGYKPSRLFGLLSAYGGVGTARTLINGPFPSDGFTELLLRGRLDLTMEALVLRSPWSHLFTAEELAAAKKRLDDCGYQVGHSMAEAA
jgi:hypothetical protein